MVSFQAQKRFVATSVVVSYAAMAFAQSKIPPPMVEVPPVVANKYLENPVPDSGSQLFTRKKEGLTHPTGCVFEC